MSHKCKKSQSSYIIILLVFSQTNFKKASIFQEIMVQSINKGFLQIQSASFIFAQLPPYWCSCRISVQLCYRLTARSSKVSGNLECSSNMSNRSKMIHTLDCNSTGSSQILANAPKQVACMPSTHSKTS